ncbi:PLPL1 protein, partial [Scopus umbretta]|nr:PLPL1 protein [Scopus umbretta]
PFSILFRGCSSLVVYEVGVLVALQQLSPDILKSASRIYGLSSGSVVAAFALCEMDPGKGYVLPFVLCLKRLNVWKFRICNIIKDALNKHLPVNAHQRVSGKLHVILTRLRDCRSVVVSEFASKEDLIQALICSCFIPLWFGFSIPVYHGVRYIDGELGTCWANFVSQTTITISGFAGEYDICPRDGPAAFFTFQISNCTLQISKRNVFRLKHIL